VAPNALDRRFYCWQPNRAWVSNITFVATDEGWLFLAAILDLASRRIVGWIEGYYNRQRMHTSIDYCTPVEYETRRAAA